MPQGTSTPAHLACSPRWSGLTVICALLLCAFALFLSACGSSGADACSPGEFRVCACADGNMGQQSCVGEAYGVCSCAMDNNPMENNGDMASSPFNACGGQQDLVFDGQAAQPGDVCGDCERGVLRCADNDTLECFGATGLNSCGSCDRLPAKAGDACGACGEGRWFCEQDGDDRNTGKLRCRESNLRNPCGGCEEIEDNWKLFQSCRTQETNALGLFRCTSLDEFQCIPFGGNRCGGTTTLDTPPLQPCGECMAGTSVCVGPEQTSCLEPGGDSKNACGGCGPLPQQLGESCGSCGGSWTCDPDNPGEVICERGPNACGGCQELTFNGQPATIGSSCMGGGQLVCDGLEALACRSNTNLCGGQGALGTMPGATCGACSGGFAFCVGRESVACFGDSSNLCGGCAPLPAEPGTRCPQGFWRCDPDNPGALICVTAPTCEVEEPGQSLGESCGTCGTLACPEDRSNDQPAICLGGRDGMNDPNHCGGCNIRCDPLERCDGDSCVPDPIVDIELSLNTLCAISEAGRVLCMGENTLPGPGRRLGAREVYIAPNLQDAVQLDLNVFFEGGNRRDNGCVRRSTGEVHCWGLAALSGQADFDGDPEVLDIEQGPVNNIRNAIDVAVAPDVACAIEANMPGGDRGTLYCWGRNLQQQPLLRELAPLNQDVLEPVAFADVHNDLADLRNVIDVSLDEGIGCAVTAMGDVYCWGSAVPAGAGPGVIRSKPEKITNINTNAIEASDNAVAVEVRYTGGALSKKYICVLHAGGWTSCWSSDGRDFIGPRRAGEPTRSNEVGRIKAINNATQISLGNSHRCVLLDDDTPTCFGQLAAIGRGPADDTDTTADPLPPFQSDRPGLCSGSCPDWSRPLLDLSVASRAACMLTTDHDLYCWGLDASLLPGNQGEDQPNSFTSAEVLYPVLRTFSAQPTSETFYCEDGLDNDMDGEIDTDDDDCALDLVSNRRVFLDGWPTSDLITCPGEDVDGRTAYLRWSAPTAGNYRFTITGTTQNNYALALREDTVRNETFSYTANNMPPRICNIQESIEVTGMQQGDELIVLLKHFADDHDTNPAVTVTKL